MKHVIRFVRDHRVEHPATVLESTLMTTGEVTHIADIPASTTRYVAGEECAFRNKRDARAFLLAMGDAAVMVQS